MVRGHRAADQVFAGFGYAGTGAVVFIVEKGFHTVFVEKRVFVVFVVRVIIVVITIFGVGCFVIRSLEKNDFVAMVLKLEVWLGSFGEVGANIDCRL